MMYVRPGWTIGEEPKEDNNEEQVYDEDGDDNQDPEGPKKRLLRTPLSWESLTMRQPKVIERLDR